MTEPTPNTSGEGAVAAPGLLEQFKESAPVTYTGTPTKKTHEANGVVEYIVLNLEEWYDGSVLPEGASSTYEPISLVVPMSFKIEKLPDPADFLWDTGDPKIDPVNRFAIYSGQYLNGRVIPSYPNASISTPKSSSDIYINEGADQAIRKLGYLTVPEFFAVMEISMWLSKSPERDNACLGLELSATTLGEVIPPLSIINPDASLETLGILYVNRTHHYVEDTHKTYTLSMEISDKLFKADQSYNILKLNKLRYLALRPEIDPRNIPEEDQEAIDAYKGEWYLHIAAGVFFLPQTQIKYLTGSNQPT